MQNSRFEMTTVLQYEKVSLYSMDQDQPSYENVKSYRTDESKNKKSADNSCNDATAVYNEFNGKLML